MNSKVTSPSGDVSRYVWNAWPARCASASSKGQWSVKGAASRKEAHLALPSRTAPPCHELSRCFQHRSERPCPGMRQRAPWLCQRCPPGRGRCESGERAFIPVPCLGALVSLHHLKRIPPKRARKTGGHHLKRRLRNGVESRCVAPDKISSPEKRPVACPSGAQ